MSYYNGIREPDEYSKDWEHPGISNERAFWMLGYECGYNGCKFDYGIDCWPGGEEGIDRVAERNELHKLQQQLEAYKALEAARDRVADKDFDPPK